MNMIDIIYISIIYIILGILSTVYLAYNPYRGNFDWELSDGWVFFKYQALLLWIIAIVLFPILLPKTVLNRFQERKAIQDWKRNGRCIKKLK